MSIVENRRLVGQFAPDLHVASEFHFSVTFGMDSLLGLEDSWNKIVSEDPTLSPFTNWHAMLAWLENFADRAEIVTVVVQNHGHTVAIVPFFSRDRARAWHEKRLQMTGFDTLAKFPSLNEEPIYAMNPNEDQAEIVWTQLADYLHELLRTGRWDSIAYRRWTYLMDRPEWTRRRDSIVEIRTYQRGSEIVDLPDTWDKYKKMLSKSMRENIPYYPKKLTKDGLEHNVTFSNVKEVGKDLDRLSRLHKQRVDEDVTGGHRNYLLHPRKTSYLHDICVSGDSFVANLEVGGKIVASQLFMKKGTCLLALHSGFDGAFSKYSPLFILQSKVFQMAIESGITRLNLLPGNAQWQNRWCAEALSSIEIVTIASKSRASKVRQLLGFAKSKWATARHLNSK